MGQAKNLNYISYNRKLPLKKGGVRRQTLGWQRWTAAHPFFTERKRNLHPFYRALGYKPIYSTRKRVYKTKSFRYDNSVRLAFNRCRHQYENRFAHYTARQAFCATQPRRSSKRFSYYKTKFLMRKFVWDNYLGKVSWRKFYNNAVTRVKHYRLERFISNNEMKLMPIALRTKTFKTATIGNQLIKHRFILVNWSASTSPFATISSGDVVSADLRRFFIRKSGKRRHRYFNRLGLSHRKRLNPRYKKPWQPRYQTLHKPIVPYEKMSHAFPSRRLSLRSRYKPIATKYRVKAFWWAKNKMFNKEKKGGVNHVQQRLWERSNKAKFNKITPNLGKNIVRKSLSLHKQQW